MGRSNSESPVRAQGSSRKRSPTQRERSPARHRSSNADKLSSRNRSPKRDRPRSPAFHSPVRERPSSRTKSPRHRKSTSPASRSPVRQKTSSRIRSPLPVSPVKEKPSSRTRSPKRSKARLSLSQSPDKGKLSTRARSPMNDRPRSPASLSNSPRSKRLKRAKIEQDTEKGSVREREKNHGRTSYRSAHEEREFGRDLSTERKDRRPQRDADGDGSRPRHRHSSSPSDRHHRGQRRSRSPYAADNRERDELTNSSDAELRNGGDDSIAKMKAAEEKLEAKEKQKPSFELSGKLAAETNRVRGVTLLYNEEPPDARKPDIRWRLYVFKGGEVLNEPLYIHRQSCYLFGRERRVVDIPTDHPSCSKQHAVLQYRQVEEENPDGTMSKRVRPYLMDLGSTNGTFINDNQIEPKRYYELLEKDTIKFGNSSREYVLLHENSVG